MSSQPVPIRSPWPSNPTLRPLTDRRINYYIRHGFYGHARAARMQRVDKLTVPKKPKRFDVSNLF